MSLTRRLQLVGINDSGKSPGDWLKTAVKVAFATSDMKHVDQHFGAAQCFCIYAVDLDRSGLLEVSEFGRQEMDGNEDKLGAKIEVLQECIAVYIQAVGASAINQLKANGIQPVKVSPGASIDELLESLQQELRHGPGNWLARAIAANLPQSPARFDRMEEEGWKE